MRITTALLFLTVTPLRAEEASLSAQAKAAVAKALPLLWKGAQGHVAERSCFACHNQGVPIFAFTTARQRGFSVSEPELKKQVEFIAAFLDRNREDYQKGKGQGGQVDTAGYALLSLELGGWKPDKATAAAAEYLLLRDQDLDHWRTTSSRPPSEASDFTPPYLALRALRKWGTEGQKERIDKRIEAVRAWLLKTEPKDTEDRVFRLWALQAARAPHKAVKSAARALAQLQRDDGGWAQSDPLASDAYATGSVLVALHEAGSLATTKPAYERGVPLWPLRLRRDQGHAERTGRRCRPAGGCAPR